MDSTHAVILDLDGTLFDTREDIADAVNHARTDFNLSELTLQQITSMVGNGISVLTARAFHGTPISLPEAEASIMEYYLAHPTRKARLYDGVRENLPLIRCLRTIVSNKPKALVDSLLDKHQIKDYFSFVAGGDTFARRKPDPVAVDSIRKDFGIAQGHCIIIGDHTPDIQMARLAREPSIYCNYGFFGNDLVGADYCVDSFKEIPALVETIITS
jgi:phosphoglycolate phosphatase